MSELAVIIYCILTPCIAASAIAGLVKQIKKELYCAANASRPHGLGNGYNDRQSAQNFTYCFKRLSPFLFTAFAWVFLLGLLAGGVIRAYI